MSDFTLSTLAAIIARRARNADPESSYTARLLSRGVHQTAKKFGEEAVEAALAAVSADKRALRGEAADVLYHLMVMLNARGVKLSEVMKELQKRTAQSGLAEKASRGKKPV
jgi:phosphoribosyl-ATP pyrophosphohydrolase